MSVLQAYEVFQYLNPKRKSAYSGSIMLKIRRYSDGECAGYPSRNIGEITPETPQYRFPANFPKGLEVFGAWQIKQAGSSLPLRVCDLVESPFAVLNSTNLDFLQSRPSGGACLLNRQPS